MCRRCGVRVRCMRFVRMEMVRGGVRGGMMVDVSISGLPMVRGGGGGLMGEMGRVVFMAVEWWCCLGLLVKSMNAMLLLNNSCGFLCDEYSRHERMK
jgi:hypothetical protein